MKVLERVYLLFYSPPTMHDIVIAYELLFLPGTSRRSEKLPLGSPSLGAGGWDSLFVHFFGSRCACKKGWIGRSYMDIFFHARRVKLHEPVRNIPFNVYHDINILYAPILTDILVHNLCFLMSCHACNFRRSMSRIYSSHVPIQRQLRNDVP